MMNGWNRGANLRGFGRAGVEVGREMLGVALFKEVVGECESENGGEGGQGAGGDGVADDAGGEAAALAKVDSNEAGDEGGGGGDDGQPAIGVGQDDDGSDGEADAEDGGELC